MKTTESIQPQDADVTEEEILVVLQRLKTLNTDRGSTTSSEDVFRSLTPAPTPVSQL